MVLKAHFQSQLHERGRAGPTVRAVGGFVIMGSLLLLLVLLFPWKDPAHSKACQDLGGIFRFTCICSLLQCHTIIPAHQAFFYSVIIPFFKKWICALWTQVCHLPPDSRQSNRLSDSQGQCSGGDAAFLGCLCPDTPPHSAPGVLLWPAVTQLLFFFAFYRNANVPSFSLPPGRRKARAVKLENWSWLK